MGSDNNKNASLDILILHGQSIPIVIALKEFFQGLGITAGTVLDLPSGQQLQYSRVVEHIKSCRLCLVLATFDDESQNTRVPRANVIHELTLCIENRPKDTIVLQESMNGILVDVGSNFDGRLITLQFTIAHLHKLFPPLLKELRERKLFVPISREGLQSGEKLDTARELNDFLDQMDRLWSRFDEASKKISRDDGPTQEKFADNLDRFFICYWDVFDALIRKKATAIQLKEVVEKEIAKSVAILEQVWKDTSDALIDKASDLKSSKRKSRNLPALMPLYQKSQDLLKKIRKGPNIKERMEYYELVANTLDEFIRKLEEGK